MPFLYTVQTIRTLAFCIDLSLSFICILLIFFSSSFLQFVIAVVAVTIPLISFHLCFYLVLSYLWSLVVILPQVFIAWTVPSSSNEIEENGTIIIIIQKKSQKKYFAPIRGSVYIRLTFQAGFNIYIDHPRLISSVLYASLYLNRRSGPTLKRIRREFDSTTNRFLYTFAVVLPSSQTFHPFHLFTVFSSSFFFIWFHLISNEQ